MNANTESRASGAPHIDALTPEGIVGRMLELDATIIEAVARQRPNIAAVCGSFTRCSNIVNPFI